MLTEIEPAAKPFRALIANGAFCEVLDEHRQRLAGERIDVIAPQQADALAPDRVLELGRDVDAIFGPSGGLDEALFSSSRRLQVVSIAASGYESVDLAAATRAGVVVTCAPAQAGSEAVADLTWGLLLSATREIAQCHHRIVTQPSRRSLAQQPRPAGEFVWRKTLGIVGLGAIGKCVARRAAGFDMRVLACDPNWDADFARRHDVERADLSDLLRQSDYVSLHVRETPETHGLIGREELALVKPTVCVISTARASILDVAALHDALVEGRVAAAALDTAVDVPGNPLIDLPNVVSTPHLGSRCRPAVYDIMSLAIDNAAAVLQGRRAPFVVNPSVYDRRELRCRK